MEPIANFIAANKHLSVAAGIALALTVIFFVAMGRIFRRAK